jgi:cyclic pyranopterin phosphate synthase
MPDPASPPIPESRLIDRFGRQVTYLRISVTDRCDFRCLYCMSEDMSFVPRRQILSLEEMLRIATAFVGLGVRKIRVTGGEPLVRKNVLWLFERLGELPGLEELVVTTNGSQLQALARPLRQAGVRRVNISLDSLDAQRFRRLTRVGELDKVLRGIEAAGEAGFERLKLNSVILKQKNDDEVATLARFALERGMDISFIEEMPLGEIHSHARHELFCSSDEVLGRLRKEFAMRPVNESSGGPSRYYQVNGYHNRIGFISPHSHNFCDDCNRVRLTAEGRLLLCLGQEHSADLRQVVRDFPRDDERLREAIVRAMAIKPRGHEFDLGQPVVIQRHMSVSGG